MPNYGALPNVPTATGQSATALDPGSVMQLFAAEQPAAGQASIAIAPTLPGSEGYRPIAFDIEFAAVPAGDLLIQGAMVDADASYQTLYTSTAKQQDYYADEGNFQFYRAKNSSSAAGGNLTVTVRR